MLATLNRWNRRINDWADVAAEHLGSIAWLPSTVDGRMRLFIVLCVLTAYLSYAGTFWINDACYAAADWIERRQAAAEERARRKAE